MANIFSYQDNTFHTGDTVALHLNVVEGEKTRIQLFEGIIIGITGRNAGKSVLVRKIGANAVGVERLVPLSSPNLIKIELKSRGRVRRAKLYYLRDRVGRQASKVKTKIETRTKPSPLKSKTTKTVSKNKSPKKSTKKVSPKASAK